MKYYDSMGFESEHGIWVRRVDAAELAADAAHLASERDSLEGRIRELEAALRVADWKIAQAMMVCSPEALMFLPTKRYLAESVLGWLSRDPPESYQAKPEG